MNRELKFHRDKADRLMYWFCSHYSAHKSIQKAKKRGKQYKARYTRREYKRLLENESI